MRNNETKDAVELEDVKVLNVTGSAILIDYEGVEAWLPKSQIDCPYTFEVGSQHDIMVPMWIAVDKGLV